MSTRCQIYFGDERNPEQALIYRHSDGYPEGIIPDMQNFFRDVEEQCSGGMSGTRFDDPPYLAAKFVVWQSQEYARSSEKPLDFLSLGVDNHIHGDIDFLYYVKCQRGSLFQPESGDYPTVTCHTPNGELIEVDEKGNILDDEY